MVSVNVTVREHLEGVALYNALVTVTADISAIWDSVFPQMNNKDAVISDTVTRQCEILTDTEGRAVLNLETGDIISRFKKESGAEGPPSELRITLKIKVQYAGVEKEIIYHKYHDKQIGKDTVITEVVEMSLGQIIIGHTGPDFSTLWFYYPGRLNSEKFTCKLYNSGEVREYSLNFKDEKVVTAVIKVDDLKPETFYQVELLRYEGEESNVLTTGSFTSFSEKSSNLNFVFASCHSPTEEASLERWKALAETTTQTNVLFLIGDQIYDNDLEDMGDTWIERYIRRYIDFWELKPVKKVMSNIPTYMVWDDHELMDDWGCGVKNFDPKFDPKNQARFEGAKQSYLIFQQSHNPGGREGTFHYNINIGKSAFYFMDSRGERAESEEHPLFGDRQWADFIRWAESEKTRNSDLIFFMSPVPLALMPVRELIKLRVKIDHRFRQFFPVITGLAGAVAGRLVSKNPLLSVLTGVTSLAAGRLYSKNISLINMLMERAMNEKNFMTGLDIADQWTAPHNENELQRTLDVLFDLANDIDKNGFAGNKKREVFVLSGDSHVGAIYQLTSNLKRHKKVPLLHQFISSPISNSPFNNRLFDNMIRHVKDQMNIVKFLTETLAIDRRFAHFTLCVEGDKQVYEAYNEGLIGERNFGRVQIEETGQGQYDVTVTINGQEKQMCKEIKVDLGKKSEEEVRSTLPYRRT